MHNVDDVSSSILALCATSGALRSACLSPTAAGNTAGVVGCSLPAWRVHVPRSLAAALAWGGGGADGRKKHLQHLQPCLVLKLASKKWHLPLLPLLYAGAISVLK
jgi:hypothetical protein